MSILFASNYFCQLWFIVLCFSRLQALFVFTLCLSVCCFIVLEFMVSVWCLVCCRYLIAGSFCFDVFVQNFDMFFCGVCWVSLFCLVLLVVWQLKAGCGIYDNSVACIGCVYVIIFVRFSDLLFCCILFGGYFGWGLIVLFIMF